MQRVWSDKRSSGFTLLEVVLSIAILTVGLTAVVSVYMVALSWVSEIRIDLTALQTARIVMVDAGVLTDESDVSAGFNNRSVKASGWVNDYFVVRTYDPAQAVSLPNNGGDYVKVVVKVYAGGDENDGALAQHLFCHQIIPKEYLP